MGASERIGRGLELVRSDGFADACRRRPQDFTRRRKTPHDALVESVVCRKGRTLRIELRELGRGLGMVDPISAPGYLKQREKLNPAALQALMRHHAEQVYADGDAVCEFDFGRQRIASIRRKAPETFEALLAHGPVDVRCVLVDIGGEAPEKLITNLPASFTPDDLKELYHLRWGVETCFQMLKDRLQMENPTGTKPVLIEQDIYATAYLLNVAFDIANEADAAALAAGAPERYKHEMTVNRSFALGVAKDELLGMLLAEDAERDGIMSRIVDELKGCLVPVRRDRSYPRDGVEHNRANRYRNTHKRVF